MLCTVDAGLHAAAISIPPSLFVDYEQCPKRQYLQELEFTYVFWTQIYNIFFTRQ